MCIMNRRQDTGADSVEKCVHRKHFIRLCHKQFIIIAPPYYIDGDMLDEIFQS